MVRAGIDIGGTKTLIVVVDEAQVVFSKSIPTGGIDRTIASCLEALATCPGFVSIGIGCPGPLDEKAGIVLNDDTLTGWHGRNVLEPFRSRFDVPVSLVNDADAALLGEISVGSLREYSSQPVAMLTFGTGVGGALWDGNRLVSGAFGEHPEIGHMIVASEGPGCYCGLQGCLESLTSGPAVLQLAQFLGFVDLESFFGEQDSPHVQRLLGYIERGLWNLAHVFRPAAVCLGGGMMESFYSRLWTTSSIEAKMLIQPMAVVQAKLGNAAGAYGAASVIQGTSSTA